MTMSPKSQDAGRGDCEQCGKQDTSLVWNAGDRVCADCDENSP